MDYMYDIKEKLCRELENYADKGDLSVGDLDTIDKLAHSVKSLATIMAMEGYSGEYSGEYSRKYSRGYSNEYSGRGSSRESSGARRRDSMGRYSRDDGMEHIVRSMRELMNKTSDPRAKDAIRQAVSEIERG